MTKAFPLPAEVVNLPPELQDVQLTAKQKKKDEKRRDDLLKLAGSAARLSPAEAEMAHAHVRVANAELQLEHLKGLHYLKPKARGCTKTQLDRAIRAQAVTLAEALIDVGNIAGAHVALTLYCPRSPLLKQTIALHRALTIPDDEHCVCPVEHLIIKRTLRDIARDRDVVLVHCSRCGHMNATATLPERLNKLQQSRHIATEGETDAHVFARAEVVIGKRV